MKKMHVREQYRPQTLITLVQLAGVFAIAACVGTLIFCAFYLGLLEPNTPAADVVSFLLGGVGTVACLTWMLMEFVLMCGRVRRSTAFTAVNVRALGRIALALFIAGGLLLPVGAPLMDWLLLGLRGAGMTLAQLLPTLLAWTAALMARAVQVLMRRAVEMQCEQELTI